MPVATDTGDKEQVGLAATVRRGMEAPGRPTPDAPLSSSPIDRVLSYLREHKGARRALSVSSVLLLVAAVGLLGYPLFTNVYQSHLQARLARQLADPALAQEYRSNAVPIGNGLTRIQIPAIGVDVVVVEGTTEEALKAGAGHYPSTPLPCEQGDVAIAGHRTTFGRPFADVDRLKPGDRISLSTPMGVCTYQVSRSPFVVLPTDVSVVDNTPGQYTLTLTSCTPKGSAAYRIVVKATMVNPQPQTLTPQPSQQQPAQPQPSQPQTSQPPKLPAPQ